MAAPTDSSRIDDLERRVASDPRSIAFAQLAEEYRRAGRYADAAAVCRAGLAHHPGFLSARVTLGRALIELDQLDDALRELQFVIQASPDHLAAIRGLAEIHQRRGEFKEATVYYRRALPLAALDAPPDQASGQPWRPRGTGPVDFDGILAALGHGSGAPPAVESLLSGEPAAAPPTVEPTLSVPDRHSGTDALGDLERELRAYGPGSGTAAAAARTSPANWEVEELAVLAALEDWLHAIHADRDRRSRRTL